MKKILSLICLIAGTSLCFAQNSTDESYCVNVDWQVGTSKTIHQIDSTVIYANDSIFMETEITSTYTIEILSKKDTVYEVLFKQIELDEEIFMESDMMDISPIEKMLQELIVELEAKMTGLEYSFLVDKNTALAFEVKNADDLKSLIEEAVVIGLNKYLDESKIELTESDKEQMQLEIIQYMEDQMPAAMQTMLNAFNYIFQAYSFPFILDKTYTQDVEVYSIDQIQYADKDSKAQLVVNSALEEDILEIDYEYIYDKEEAYQIYVVDQGKEAEISRDDFDVEERVISHFDMETSWILNSLSLTSAKLDYVTVNTKTLVRIE